MNKIELGKRLFEMTVDDLKQLISEEDAVSTGIMKLDLAAKTRRAIHAVQLEGMWPAFNDEIQDFAIYLELKLSHMTLCSVLDCDQDLNELQWQLIIRRIDSINEDMRPTCFGEYLLLADQVYVDNIENYNLEATCQFLDKAYDFSWQRDMPGSSYRPGR
jgi:hypothetical protein